MTMPILQGTLDVLVLKALEEAPQHGYGVAQWIRARSENALEIEDGALYTALHRLEKKRLLESEWGISDANRRAKYYRLTLAGRRQLARQATQWGEYAAAVFRVLGTEGRA